MHSGNALPAQIYNIIIFAVPYESKRVDRKCTYPTDHVIRSSSTKSN